MGLATNGAGHASGTVCYAIITSPICRAGGNYGGRPGLKPGPGAVTADQQKNNHSDRELTKEIRQSVMADKSLSSYAHNVKIVTQDGAVTLQGPVKSEDEKREVLSKAEQVAGSGKVSDQLSVKAAQ